MSEMEVVGSDEEGEDQKAPETIIVTPSQDVEATKDEVTMDAGSFSIKKFVAENKTLAMGISIGAGHRRFYSPRFL